MTIYDIAAQAGVSASTVSRVINHKPGIKEQTRRRVERLLKENNYTPNAAARGLVKQSTRFVGLLIEDIRVEHHTESAYIIEQEMTSRGYTCITFSTGGDPERKAEYIRILEEHRVDGAILIGSMFGTQQVAQRIDKHLRGIPVVLLNGMMKRPNVYSVRVDEDRGLECCVDYLLDTGRKHIAFVMDAQTPSAQNKLRGFLSGARNRGLIDPPVYRVFGADTGPVDAIRRGEAVVPRILEQYPQVDALLCSIDLMAVGCLRGLQGQGIAVPEQVAVMGVDNDLCGQLCTPTLTTLNNNLDRVSRTAARLLLDALEQQQPTHELILPAEIIPRQST